MSKPKHNYSQYSSNKNNREPNNDKPARSERMRFQAAEPAMEPVMPVSERIEPIIDPVIKPVVETVDTVSLPKTVEGVVANCAKLNVRSIPSITGSVVCVLDVMSEMEIDIEKSTSEWFYICTAAGVEGYCMRKFVEARL